MCCSKYFLPLHQTALNICVPCKITVILKNKFISFLNMKITLLDWDSIYGKLKFKLRFGACNKLSDFWCLKTTKDNYDLFHLTFKTICNNRYNNRYFVPNSKVILLAIIQQLCITQDKFERVLWCNKINGVECELRWGTPSSRKTQKELNMIDGLWEWEWHSVYTEGVN